MVDLLDGRRETVVAAVATEAGVVGELLCVIAEVELVVGLEEVASVHNEFGLAVALEATARNDVEGAVGAVADISGVTATLDLDVVNILGIDLRGKVAANVGVWNFHAVDLPVKLVAAAHVQHVMCHIGSGREVGDHGHAVGAVCSGSLGDVLASDERCGRYAVYVRCGYDSAYGDGLLDRANLHFEVQHGRCIRSQSDRLRLGCEAVLRDGDGVVTKGY